MVAIETEDFIFVAIVTAIQVLCYNFLDVMGVGKARRKHKVAYPKCTGPPEFESAFRAQQNQAEQMPTFFVSMWACAAMFDGRVAGGLGLLWVLLRQLYTSSYRNSGFSMGLLKFTIPAYLCINLLSLLAAGAGIYTLVQNPSLLF
eukprot:CAMPEP_0119133584 /NCGR_PEP_ID=MMETSP1310-20130426/13454_1 /TAXON_ID=464262 /ORGANISM="Genus nov. species nov., Strain RCC2339" /LENGTH=145 /DNA_ID=CAMNT_0007124283 /DNA_START=39 /DNA_END=476 /DNA_ORIENTATION=+